MREVVVLADNDPGGRQYAASVASAMLEVGLKVKRPELGLTAPGADIVDFYAAGFSNRRLKEIVDATPWLTFPDEEREYRSLEGVEPEEVRFLWYPRIPVGKLTLLDGNPGDGKSYLTADLAARGSRGDGLPSAHVLDPAASQRQFRTLIMSVEDGLADTIVPRLKTLEANLEHILVWQKPITFNPEGLRKIERAIVRERIELVIIDPLVSFIGSKLDMFRANETRPVLDALGLVARRTGCALLCIRHLTKGEREHALYRGQGSIDFSAVARSVLLLGRNPKDDSERVLVHIKSSLAAAGASLAFTISDKGVEWLGESHLTAEDLFARKGGGRQLDNAAKFLRRELDRGPVSSNRLFRIAKQAGHSRRTLERVKALGMVPVVASPERTKGVRGVARWHWALDTREFGGQNPRREDSGHKDGHGRGPTRPPKAEAPIGGLTWGKKKPQTGRKAGARRSRPPNPRGTTGSRRGPG